MLKRQHGAADERLSELVAEVAGAVGSLDEDLFGRLVEPFAHGQNVLPVATAVDARIGGHVDCRTCDGPRACATAHTVANFTAGACSSTVEGLYGGGEVVGLGLQGNHTLDVFHLEVVAGRLVFRGKLLDGGALSEGHVVLVGRKYLVGVLLRRLLNHGKEARLHFLAVDDEGSTENLVAAVLGVDLGKAENLAVGQRASVLLLQSVQVFYFLGRKGKAFLLVVFFKILYVLDGLGLDVDGEDVLIQTLVHALQHGVVVGVLRADGEVLLNAFDAAEVHVLGYFHGVGRPGGDHFAARTNEESFDAFALKQLCVAVEPA